MKTRPDILILGAGIVGLACARELRRRGASVQVWERRSARRAPGAPLDGDPDLAVASAASAGMLAPLAEVHDSAEFRALCREARDAWTRWAPQLEAETGLDLDYDRSGALIVDEEGWIAEIRTEAERAGEPFELLSAREVRQWMPDVGSTMPAGALFLPGEHRVDNRRVCHALDRALRAAGAELRYGTRAVSLLPGPGTVRVEGVAGANTPLTVEAGRVLVTAGAWSPQISGLPPLPIDPVRGQMVCLGGIEWPFTGCVRGREIYGVRRQGGRLLVGATVERVGFEARVTPAGLDELRRFLHRFLPGTLDKTLAGSWAGLRPGTPDGRPLIGPVLASSSDGGGGGDTPRVFLAAGHFRNGVLLAPWTARHIAERMLDPGLAASGAAASEAAALFAPDRFDLSPADETPLGQGV